MSLNAAEVGELLGISSRFVYDLFKTGKLPGYRHGRAIRFAPADVEAYRASCRFTGPLETSVGATSSTATFKAAATGLAACFQRAGVKPRQTPMTEPKARASTRLRLASATKIP